MASINNLPPPQVIHEENMSEIGGSIMVNWYPKSIGRQLDTNGQLQFDGTTTWVSPRMWDARFLKESNQCGIRVLPRIASPWHGLASVQQTVLVFHDIH